MLAKYAMFTIITSVFSFWCINQVKEPYQYIHDFYNSFCVYLSKKVNDFLSNRNILTCVAALERDNKLFESEETEILFTDEMLRKYSGDNEILYLSILGEVFDVTKGKKHYGPGQGYHGFTGRINFI